MADDVDRLNDMMDVELAHALSKIRQNSAQKIEGSKFCIECEDEMPLARQSMGFKFCVSCAEERERRKSMFAG